MKPNIVVFGTPSCGWCRKVKDYIKSKGYGFKYVDVASDVVAMRDMVRKSGQQGVPQLWIDNVVVVGFDQRKIDSLLTKTK